jgi:hypothetical protein
MLSIRPAIAADASLILDFIRRLAEYEREPNKFVHDYAVSHWSYSGSRKEVSR